MNTGTVQQADSPIILQGAALREAVCKGAAQSVTMYYTQCPDSCMHRSGMSRYTSFVSSCNCICLCHASRQHTDLIVLQNAHAEAELLQVAAPAYIRVTMFDLKMRFTDHMELPAWQKWSQLQDALSSTTASSVQKQRSRMQPRMQKITTAMFPPARLLHQAVGNHMKHSLPEGLPGQLSLLQGADSITYAATRLVFKDQSRHSLA